MATSHPKDVVITGYGIVSALGSDPAEIWDAVSVQSYQDTADTTRFAPYITQPAKTYDPASIIAKKSHIRGMGRFQLNTAYAAGAALRSAQLTEDMKAELPLILACSDGERDEALDRTLYDALPDTDDKDTLINKSLSNLRPTLFLCQLPNLFSANVSIAHGVTGSSVTFMGDENAGANALRIAVERIRSGQDKRVLIGGSYGPRIDKIKAFASQGLLQKDKLAPVWTRTERPISFGEGAAFILLESKDTALERGAHIKAIISNYGINYSKRRENSASRWLTDTISQWSVAPDTAVLSGSSCRYCDQKQELDVWKTHQLRYRGIATFTGSLMEASVPVSLALATACLERGELLPPICSEEEESPGAMNSILVNQWGFNRGETLIQLDTVLQKQGQENS